MPGSGKEKAPRLDKRTKRRSICIVRVKIDLQPAFAHNASFWAIGKGCAGWKSGRSAVVEESRTACRWR